MFETCFSTRASVTTRRSAMRVVRAALGHQPEHLALARRELVERLSSAPPSSWATASGSIAGAALGDAPHGVDELAERRRRGP
jgi:hypothetical protein